MSRNNNYRFVYSTDGAHKNLCKVCESSPCKCKKVKSVNPSETTLKIRLEKNGRGGKSVSVIFELPHNPDYFADIAKKLKAQCGAGGTYKDDQIEIQGDHREKIKNFLEKIGFKVKLAGG
jgi:translation initiation factor 1